MCKSLNADLQEQNIQIYRRFTAIESEQKFVVFLGEFKRHDLNILHRLTILFHYIPPFLKMFRDSIFPELVIFLNDELL